MENDKGMMSIGGHFFEPKDSSASGAAANAEMLVLARGSRGYTQEALAQLMGISPAKLSKYEGGVLKVSEEDLNGFVEHLKYPREFFLQGDSIQGFGSCCQYHRKRQSLPAKHLSLIHDQVNVVRIQVARLTKRVDIRAKIDFPVFDVDAYESPEEIARLVRATWRMPRGPVRNLVTQIEAAGGIVVRMPFGTRLIDAVSQWPANMPPLFFINDEIPADRWRFTLAHELGHIVMHRIPTPDAEEEADRFASEFLMPAADISEELRGMTFQKAARMKPFWRVSMQALILKAKSVGAISDRKCASLFAYMSKLQCRKNEPVQIEQETPTLLKAMIDLHFNEYEYDVRQLSQLMLSEESEFRCRYLNENKPGLRVVH